MKQAEWYVDWFNSPYYHLLYNKRNLSEANLLIDNLCDAIHLGPGAKVWDMACGKGRHAIALNKKGLDVTGSDLSENSIRDASQFSNDNLHFLVHDMRKPFRENYFEAVFNLFTSFGYFEEAADNYQVFQNAATALKDGGHFLIDYFNAKMVRKGCNMEYSEQRGSLRFDISKTISESQVVKRIEFSDQGHDYYFEEKVALFSRAELEKFADGTGLKVEKVFGNYFFEPFDEDTSDRLLILFRK